MTCIFYAYEVCSNFHRGLLHRGRQTGVEPLKLVIYHLMQRHFSNILRFVALCDIMKALSGFLMTQRRISLN